MQHSLAFAGDGGLAGLGFGLLRRGDRAFRVGDGCLKIRKRAFAFGRLPAEDAGHVGDGFQVAADVHEEWAGAGVGEQALGVAVGFQQGFNSGALPAAPLQQRSAVRQFGGDLGASLQLPEAPASLVVGLHHGFAFAHPAGVQGARVFAGLAERGFGAGLALARLLDRMPEGGPHLAESRFRVPIGLDLSHGHGLSDFPAGFRQVVSRPIPAGNQASAFQVQVARSELDGLEFRGPSLRRLICQVGQPSLGKHSRRATSLPHGRVGALVLRRRLPAMFDGGRVRPLGGFNGLAPRVLRRQIRGRGFQLDGRLSLRRASLFKCLPRRGQASQQFRFGSETAFQVGCCDLQLVAGGRVVLGEAPQQIGGLLVLGGAQDGGRNGPCAGGGESRKSAVRRPWGTPTTCSKTSAGLLRPSTPS